MAGKNGAEALRKHAQTLKAKHCTELSYRIVAPNDKFDVERFANSIGPLVSESRGWNTILLAARNYKVADYHVHVYWKPDQEDPSKTRLQVDAHAWRPEEKNAHKELKAEDVFDWVGQFFKGTTENAHVHADFEYPKKHWQSRIMVLPITVPFADKTAEINGLSVNIPSQPQGVKQVWLSTDKDDINLQLFGDRRIVFKNFTFHDDVDAFISVVMSLIEEKKQ